MKQPGRSIDLHLCGPQLEGVAPFQTHPDCRAPQLVTILDLQIANCNAIFKTTSDICASHSNVNYSVALKHAVSKFRSSSNGSVSVVVYIVQAIVENQDNRYIFYFRLGYQAKQHAKQLEQNYLRLPHLC